MSKEELIKLCRELEKKLESTRIIKDLYFSENEKLKTKIETILNVIKL